ncbi:MAG: hypothetical protein ABI591_17035 [Kofleriaceae bacterium]
MRPWLALVVVLSACGTDSNGGPYTPIDQLESSYQAALCTHLVACHEVADQQTCLATNLAGQGLFIDPQTVQLVLTGKVRYDGSTVAACLADVAAQTCTLNGLDKRRPFAQCIFDVFRGSVAAGGTCSTNAECISGGCTTQCGQTNTCCTGTCSPGAAPLPLTPIAIGMTCPQGTGGFDACVEGSYCDHSTQLCTALKPVGATCTDASQCGDALTCNFSMGVCATVPHLGESCATTFTCSDEGAYCDQTTTLCTQVKLIGGSCATGGCSSLLSCDSQSQLCISYPALGQSCSLAGRCGDIGTYCNNAQICAMPGPNGQLCQSAVDCVSQDCDQTTLRCTSLPTCP